MQLAGSHYPQEQQLAETGGNRFINEKKGIRLIDWIDSPRLFEFEATAKTKIRT